MLADVEGKKMEVIIYEKEKKIKWNLIWLKICVNMKIECSGLVRVYIYIYIYIHDRQLGEILPLKSWNWGNLISKWYHYDDQLISKLLSKVESWPRINTVNDLGNFEKLNKDTMWF